MPHSHAFECLARPLTAAIVALLLGLRRALALRCTAPEDHERGAGELRMSQITRTLWSSMGCSVALLCAAVQPAVAAEPLAPMRLVQVGEVQYISGGASRAERKELEARTVDFRVQVNLIAKELETAPKRVVVKLKRQGEAGRPLDLTAAGPLLLVNMPSGHYTLSASLNGAAPVESKFELQPGEFEKLDIQLDETH
jgi:hypothetical protein